MNLRGEFTVSLNAVDLATILQQPTVQSTDPKTNKYFSRSDKPWLIRVEDDSLAARVTTWAINEYE
jgi:hypothetical protein